MGKLKYIKLFESFKSDLPTVDEINDILKNPILIGSGGNARVYELNDKYVLRKIKGKREFKINNIVLVEDPLPNINYGQVVAKTDNPSITILKKQSGKPVFEQGKTTLENYKTMIKNVSNLPQETFDSFVKETKLLQDIGLTIDPSKSNNFLIDVSDKRINIVDVGVSRKFDLSFRDFFVPLVSIIFIQNNKLRGDEELKQYWRIISDKLKMSCEKYNIKIDSENCEFIFSKHDQDDKPIIKSNIDDDDGW